MATGVPEPFSRAHLAQNRAIWCAAGLGYVEFAAGTGALTATDQVGMIRGSTLAAALLVLGGAHLLAPPPRIGTWSNEAALLALWLSVAAAYGAMQPMGAVAASGAMFVGPIVAFRQVERRRIAVHTACAVVSLLLVAVVGGACGVVDGTTVVATGVATLAIPTVTLSCTAVFEAAEAQGRELAHVVRLDPLTGAGNRRMLDERLADDLQTHFRVSVIAFAIERMDDADRVSDEEQLRAITRVLAPFVTPGGWLSRFDDRFVIVEPNRAAVAAARTGATALAHLQSRPGRPALHVATATYPDDATTMQELLALVESRLSGHGGATPPVPAADGHGGDQLSRSSRTR